MEIYAVNENIYQDYASLLLGEGILPLTQILTSLLVTLPGVRKHD